MKREYDMEPRLGIREVGIRKEGKLVDEKSESNRRLVAIESANRGGEVAD